MSWKFAENARIMNATNEGIRTQIELGTDGKALSGRMRTNCKGSLIERTRADIIDNSRRNCG